MRKSLVLTVIGDDRPRIVETLAEQVLAAGANWEESQMAHVAGKFAGLLRVSVEEDRAGELSARLRTIAGGLTVVVEEAGAPPAVEGRPLRLELVGNDRPGIVRDISRALAVQHINIEELETGVESAPMTGDLLFRASALVRVPPTVTLDALRGELEALADELMVDLDVVHDDES
ncbi:MAG: glycine cleavage system protein R [Vicinamibacterales bacterium]